LSTRIDAVVVDTNVFSAALKDSSSELIELYGPDLGGKKLVISFQTAAEMRYGAARDNLGPRRRAALERRLRMAVTVPPSDAPVREWANLRNECHKRGHAFHQKVHVADLWIAATARLIDAPLVAHDKAFRGLPGLDVICRV